MARAQVAVKRLSTAIKELVASGDDPATHRPSLIKQYRADTGAILAEAAAVVEEQLAAADNPPSSDGDNTPQGWTEYLPTLLEAITDGTLDAHLHTLARSCRDRHLILHPERRSAPAANTAEAQHADFLSADQVAALDILGEGGHLIRVADRWAARPSRVPNGTVYVEELKNTYRRDAFVGQHFRIVGKFPAGLIGSVAKIVDVQRIRNEWALVCRVVFPVPGLNLADPDLRRAVDRDFAMYIKYNTRLLER